MFRCLYGMGVISFYVQRKPFPCRTLTAFASPSHPQPCSVPLETRVSTSQTPHHLDKKTEQNRELVAHLLNSYGFSKTHVDQLHAKWPRLLRVRVEKTINPKLQWLAHVGFTASEIPKMVVKNPSVLRVSLDNLLKPNFEFLRCFTGRTETVRTMICRHNRFLSLDLKKTVIPNIAHLVDLGVPGHHILRLLMTQPRVLIRTHDNFVEGVERVIKWGFNPQLSLFVNAVWAVCGLNRLTLESKVNLYKSMGWSDDNIALAVRRAPLFLLTSEEKIKKSADFFTNTVGLKPSYLFTMPKLLMYGFEKRIIPRFAVMQALKSKGLFQNKSGGKMNAGLFHYSEIKFVDKYVRRHMDEVPELMEIYRGKIVCCEALNCRGGQRE